MSILGVWFWYGGMSNNPADYDRLLQEYQGIPDAQREIAKTKAAVERGNVLEAAWREQDEEREP